MNVGYNDWAAVYDVDRLMRALKAAGVRTVVWVTLRATTSNYAQSNARIRTAARRWQGLVIADWNAYSRGKPWFREDGLHLTTSGAMGLARLLRPLVLAAPAGRKGRRVTRGIRRRESQPGVSTGLWRTGGSSRSQRMFPAGQLPAACRQAVRRRG